MRIVDPNSLAQTLDAVEGFDFCDLIIPKTHKEKAARWIARRHGMPRSYANMPAPTDKDYQDGVRLFTGERLKSKAAIGHILGEEACRALILLNVDTPGIRKALDRSKEGMLRRLDYPERTPGMYCCGTCTCSYWRHLSVGGLGNAERELSEGMHILKKHRDGKGRWGRFPFYYTLLALIDIDLPSVISEFRYAEPLLERLVKRVPKNGDVYAHRRHYLIEWALENC